MLKNKKFFLLGLVACAVCSTITVDAQTNSPYSRYGFGKLRDQSVGQSRGMGGVGYGLNTNLSANPMNPASYSQVDSLTFIFDFGIHGSKTSLQENGITNSKDNGGLDYITMLFPVSKQMGISAGILPFSSTGYKFGSTNDVGGNGAQYSKLFDGTGGISQVYVGLGYKVPVKGLSVGANFSYLFGSIEHSRRITGINTGTPDLTSEISDMNLNAVKFDLGFQYQLDLAERNNIVFGAVYSPRINSTAKLNRTRYIITGGQPSSADTLVNKAVDAGIPEMFGAGAAFNYQEKLIVAGDISLQRWKKAKFSKLLGDNLSAGDRFNNRWKFAVGAEYRVAPYSRGYFKKIKFRGGLNYTNSYVNVNTESGAAKGYKEYGATVGLGLPIIDKQDVGGRVSYININFEYKNLKPDIPSMVSEKYYGISLNVNINELWFLQRKIF